MLDSAGVYTITCSPTGAQYVGSAVCFRRRFRQHMSDLRLGTHKSTYMQRAWLKYGETAFTFDIALVCDKTQAVYFEQRVMDAYKPVFNTAKVAGSSLGIVRTPEQCELQRRLRTAINLAKPDHGVSHLTAIVRTDSFRQKQSARVRAAHAQGVYAEAQKKGARTRSKLHMVNGEALTLKQMSERYGRTVKSIQRRIERGITGDELVVPAYQVTRRG